MSHDFDSKGEHPHYPGYLTVYKAVDVTAAGTIKSPTRTHIWRPGENRATCDIYYHRPGPKRCTCGFYAYFSPGLARRYLNSWGFDCAIAICRAHGLMSVGENGVRAEKMEIVGIVTHISDEDHEKIPSPEAPLKPNQWAGTRLFSAVFLASLIVTMLFIRDFLPTWLFPVVFVASLFVSGWNIYVARRWRKFKVKLLQWEEDVKAWKAANHVAYGNWYDRNDCHLTSIRTEQVQLVYPEIQVFDNVIDALKVFPPSSADDL